MLLINYLIFQSKRSLAYGATSDMQGQQHTSDNNVYDGLQQQQHQHLQSQQQQHYLSSSPHVQQPLPASTMASSVAALQRLSASIDVTAVPASGGSGSGGPSAAAGGSSRSNSRASAYDEPCSDKSEAVQAAAAAALQSREAAEASGGGADVRDPDSGGRPQYLTANCVVYSFYNGDLTAAIDDHFNRALKTTSNERDSPPNHSESVKQQSGMSAAPSKSGLISESICNIIWHISGSHLAWW